MDTVDARRSIAPRTTHDQEVRQLALLAREHGIVIHHHDAGNRRECFATSILEPGRLHRVTLFSCDCPAFVDRQTCVHHSALLDHVGELPPPDPAEEAARQTRRAEITAARAEVARLNRNPKTAADWMRLHNAKARLLALVADPLPVAMPIESQALAA